MNRNRNQNVLLVEIMIAVLFFALSATVILETYAAARQFADRSQTETGALIEAQNLAEQLYASDDPEAILRQTGFENSENGWVLQRDEYRIELVLEQEQTSVGTIFGAKITAFSGEKTIVELPVARYLPGGDGE